MKLFNAARKKSTRTARAKARAKGIMKSVKGSFNKVMNHPATKTTTTVAKTAGVIGGIGFLASQISKRK
tara:strand:- start:164 stop:370 length:207 start_codon:yes stop_codon:yes gene_type:complete